MATREGLRKRDRSQVNERMEPDAAYLEPAGARESWRTNVTTAGILNVIAGIWLIISPFVLGYTGADATWNPIVFGAIAGTLALVRAAGAYRAEILSWVNMAIGIWLFISAFWLASSSQASWNVAVLGVIVFILAAWSVEATAEGRMLKMRR
jgi:hypothetical protein